MINYVLLISRQGKLRLAKWYTPLASKAKAKVVQDLTQLILSRKDRMCNVLEYKGKQVVYKRYASLFFACEIGENDNELITLEIIHRYVEILDRYFGNVCELDLIFNFQSAYAVLDELLAAGHMAEPSKGAVYKNVIAADQWELNQDVSEGLSREFGLPMSRPDSTLR